MSKLKVYHCNEWHNEYTEFYLKSEADKVIAELEDKLKEQTSIAEEGWKESGTYHTSYAEAVKELYDKNKEIAELKKQVHDYAQGLYVMQARSEKEIRHQKYKQCLAMAMWCDEVMMSCELRGYAVHRIWANKHQWAMRWKYRWLELADKFKEAK